MDDRGENSSRNERHQNNGTVRSIPIKDYRASLIHDMETLRRSAVPQHQFESLVSETEKNVRAAKRRSRLNFNSTSPKAEFSRASHRSKNRLESIARRSRSRRSGRKASVDGFNGNRTIEFMPSFRFIDEPVEILVDSGFHSRRTSSRKHERRTPVRDEATFRNSNDTEKIDNGVENREENSDLRCGNVCKKISVYEGNVRSSGRSERGIVRQELNGSGDRKRHRTIGVPLVGMHNACGLPVIAHWPNRRVFGTLRLPGKLVGSLRRTTNRPTSLEHRNGMPKRKAPRTPQREEDEELPVSERTEESTGSIMRKRILKRPSFKAGRNNVMPYKQRYNRKNGVKTTSFEEKSIATGGSLRNRTTTRRSVKRSTLYAKDDGNEAAEVLTNLCLNPLARNKGAANMIW